LETEHTRHFGSCLPEFAVESSLEDSHRRTFDEVGETLFGLLQFNMRPK